MPSKKFVPVSRAQAKDQIWRPVKHDTELPDQETGAPSKFGVSAQMSSRDKDADKEQKEIVQGLSDPLFASKLDKMDNTVYGKGKASFRTMAYQNDYVAK